METTVMSYMIGYILGYMVVSLTRGTSNADLNTIILIQSPLKMVPL